jgi:HEAT repeat protein
MVFGLFSKEKAFQKLVDRANNPVTQSVDRWGAMEKLRDDAREEAIFGLCKRFSFACDKSIEDQQEKDWTVATLVSLGEERALGPLRRYMKSAKNLGYPLKVLRQLTTETKIFEVIDELLADEEPGYVRNPMRRIDVIEWLGEWDVSAEEIVKRVLPYVEDFDENVRFKSIETLSHKPHPSAANAVCRAMVREDEESKRFQVRCAQLVAEQGWPIGEYKSQIEALAPTVLDNFRIEGQTLKAR